MTRTFWRQKSIPQVIIEELCRHFPRSRIVLATTVAAGDDELARLAAKLSIGCYRGDEDDVLRRFLNAVEPIQPEYLVRICADNPFLRGEFVEELMHQVDQRSWDYVSYRSQSGVPAIMTHYGLFAELVRLSSLQRIEATVKEQHYREHLTSHIVQHPTRYQSRFLPIPEFIEEAGPLRLTVDTARDFEICKNLFAEVVGRHGLSFSAKQLVESVEALPLEIRTDMAQQIQANQK